jgi:putative ABC transport system permease protein
MMIGHYLTSALAKFCRAPFTTGANVLTLALGLACFIAAYGIANYWRSADAYHQNADRAYFLGQTLILPNTANRTASPSANPTMARHIAQADLGVEAMARVVQEPSIPVAAGANKAILNVALADPGFLRIVDFDFVAGDPRAALEQPGSAVLTEEAAQRLFGDAPALGQRVLFNGVEEGIVTGVIAPVREPSFMGAGPDAALRFDVLRNWPSSVTGGRLDIIENWQAFNTYNFVLLEPEQNVETFNAALGGLIDDRIPPGTLGEGWLMVEAFPLRELTLRDLNAALFGGAAFNVSVVSALIGLGLMTLIVACVNYANLATAQAAVRARETGMRKTLGAGRAQVAFQAWLEAAALTLVGAAIAIGVLALANPVLRVWASVDVLHVFAAGAGPVLLLLGLVLAASIFASLYPALVLSGVRPIEALRPARARGGAKGLARVLVAAQFASASFLLILVTVTQLQRAHLERTVLAPREDPIVVLNDLMPIGVDYNTLETRLEALPGVESVSVVDKGPWSVNGFQPLGLAGSQEAGAASVTGWIKSVGYDYFETISQPLLAGRAFDRALDATPAPTYIFTGDRNDTLDFVIDRAYAERLGFASPQDAVDALIYLPGFGDTPAQPIRIIGVVESDTSRLDALNAGGETLVGGHIYTFAPRAAFGGQLPIVRISADRVPETLAAITRVWDELAPDIAIDVRFFDALFEQSFRLYQRISQLFLLLGASAFIIASLGLIGIAVHVTARRRHEIGVRKVLGASTLRVLRMLVADFSKPVVIGNIIAWPFAWMAAQTYLQSFAERTPLTPVPFILSLIVTLLIAWASVGGQAWKAARVKPALVLKAE